MATTSALEATISRIIAISSTVSEEELEPSLAACLSEAFGVETVRIKSELAQGSSNLLDYVVNTKRPYIDNELSEYSSFPELTLYWSRGQKSCAFVPVLLNGRVVSVIEMVSRKENIFTQDIVSSATNLAYIVGLSMSYRREEGKGLRLASYFNAAFNSPISQLLVSNEGKIVRFNSASAQEFGMPDLRPFTIPDLLKVELTEIKERSRNGRELLVRRGDKVYALHSSEAGSNLNYVTVRNVTGEELMSWATSLMGQSYGAGVVLLDKELKVSYATPSMKKIIGYDSNLTISKSMIELVSEREKGAFKEAIAASTKKESFGSVGLVTDKGIVSPVRFAISRREGGYMLLFYDASAERYVDSMAAAFNEFLDGSSDIALRVDELGYIRYANHSVVDSLGYERAELVGKEINSLYIDLAGLERDLGYARGGAKIDNSFTKLRAKDGRAVEATNSMRFFKAGDSSEYVIIAKELESKRMMKSLEETIESQQYDIKKLQGMGELKSQFIYNISHELKTPLTNIIGFSKLLNTGEFGDINEDQKTHITTIIDEANRLMDMITQVLDAAKLDSNKMKLELADVDMRSMEENPSIKALEERARNKGIEFRWSVSTISPVQADYGRLIQVFVNLIGNSIKFTDKGAIIVDIKYRSTKKNKPTAVECSVSDTGIGVSEEGRHRLFKEFYGAAKIKSTIKQEGSGTGLGLSITKKIVELHGGKIGYEPREGGGSRFWFTLPIKARRKTKSV